MGLPVIFEQYNLAKEEERLLQLSAANIQDEEAHLQYRIDAIRIRKQREEKVGGLLQGKDTATPTTLCTLVDLELREKGIDNIAKLTPSEMNELLIKVGLQVRIPAGYVLTPQGVKMEYGVTQTNGTTRSVRWNEGIAPMLAEALNFIRNNQ